MQFNSKYFIFDNIDSSMYDFILCSVQDNSDNVINGLKRSLEETNGINGLKDLINITNDYIDLDMCITKATIEGELLPFTKEDNFILNKWLFGHKEYKPLIVDGIVLNCIFIEGNSFYNENNQGYINVKLHCEPTMKTLPIVKNLYVKKQKQIVLDNETNVNENIGVDFVVNIEAGENFIIQNLTTGKKFIMNKLNNDSLKSFKIDSKLRYVESNIDKDLNMIKCIDLDNSEYIDLAYGQNILLISMDKGIVEIKYQCKISYF